MADNAIHPTAVVGDDVELGSGNTVGPYAVVLGPATIGDGNWIGPHSVIGTPGESRGAEFQPGGGLRIGNGCVIREFVTVHQGVEAETVVGDGCYLLSRSHVPHDAVLEDGVTLADSVQVGGHVWIGRNANLGLGATVHQFRRIGAYAMVAMNAAVTADVPPGALVAGVPARIVQANRVGLERAGVGPKSVAALDRFYRHLRRTGDTVGERPVLDDVLETAFDAYDHRR